MTYQVMGSRNNSCWPVPMGGRTRQSAGFSRGMGALEQATAGTGLFRNAPWRRAMGDATSTFTISGNSNNAFTIDSSGDAVASTPSAKGIFIDLQNQLNRLSAYYTFNDLLLSADGIIGPNTLAAASGVLGMLANAGLVSGLEGAAADITTLASQADTVAAYLDQQASALGAPSVSVPAAKAGGGSGASPAPATAVAKNNSVRTPLMVAGIDITDPTTLAALAAVGFGAYILAKNKKGGRRRPAKRRAPRKRARARRRPARRRKGRR